MPNDGKLDPRYDPRFQRGYDPGVRPDAEDAETFAPEPPAPEPPAPEPSAPAAGEHPHPANVPVSDEGRRSPGHIRREQALSRAAPDEWGPPAAATADDVAHAGGNDVWFFEEVAAAPEPSSARAFWLNPFLIALVVIGIGLIIVGVDRFAWATRILAPTTGFLSPSETAPPADGTDVTAQVMWAIGPLMAVAGVLTLVGVVFFAALRWIPWARARRDTVGEPDGRGRRDDAFGPWDDAVEHRADAVEHRADVMEHGDGAAGTPGRRAGNHGDAPDHPDGADHPGDADGNRVRRARRDAG